MTVEKLTGDTCFVSSLRRNRRFYSSPSSLSSIWFYFSVFSIFPFFFISGTREPKRRGNRRGQTGTCQAGREGARQKSRVQLFFSSCVCVRLSVCVREHIWECVCELLKSYSQTALLTHPGFAWVASHSQTMRSHTHTHAHCLSHTHTQCSEFWQLPRLLSWKGETGEQWSMMGW